MGKLSRSLWSLASIVFSIHPAVPAMASNPRLVLPFLSKKRRFFVLAMANKKRYTYLTRRLRLPAYVGSLKNRYEGFYGVGPCYGTSKAELLTNQGKFRGFDGAKT